LNINLDVDGLAPIPDCSLDAVIACHVIEHLVNPISALREFERVLRRQGRLVLVAPDRNVTFDSVRQPTALAHVLAKFHEGVIQVGDEDISTTNRRFFRPPCGSGTIRSILTLNYSSCIAGAAFTSIAGLPKSLPR
jgi:SAM-dependent methyltransferase